jgi:hypothetical protein
MTASEVAAARLELGLSIPDGAEELGVPESRVADGESGKARIPRFGARALSYLVAMKRRDRAIEAARLPECGWVTQRFKRPDAVDDADFRREMNEWDFHSAGCGTCQAREDYIDTHLGPEPEMPLPRSLVVFMAISRPLEAFPGWSHPAFGVAALSFALCVWLCGVDIFWWLVGQAEQPPMGCRARSPALGGVHPGRCGPGPRLRRCERALPARIRT